MNPILAACEIYQYMIAIKSFEFAQLVIVLDGTEPKEGPGPSLPNDILVCGLRYISTVCAPPGCFHAVLVECCT